SSHLFQQTSATNLAKRTSICLLASSIGFTFQLTPARPFPHYLFPGSSSHTQPILTDSSPNCRLRSSVFLRARVCIVRTSHSGCPASSWPSLRSFSGGAAKNSCIFRPLACVIIPAHFLTRKPARFC